MRNLQCSHVASLHISKAKLALLTLMPLNQKSLKALREKKSSQSFICWMKASAWSKCASSSKTKQFKTIYNDAWKSLEVPFVMLRNSTTSYLYSLWSRICTWGTCRKTQTISNAHVLRGQNKEKLPTAKIALNTHHKLVQLISFFFCIIFSLLKLTVVGNLEGA